MSHRTRKTVSGLKTRFRRARGRHGPIKRIVGDTPMQSLHEAAFARLCDEAPALLGFASTKADLVHLAAVDPELLKAKAKETTMVLFALYVSTAKYGVSGITLHRTLRDAWVAAEDCLKSLSPKWKSPGDAAELDQIIEWCEERAAMEDTDIYVCEVALPAEA